MKLDLTKIPSAEWERYCAPHAHRAAFSETLPPEYDRIDFALYVVDAETETALAYATVRELDRETAYLKHGGAFPPVAGKCAAYPVYLAMLDWIRTRYARTTTLVENTNTRYLRMALTAGFLPIGIRNFKGSILLELFLEGY